MQGKNDPSPGGWPWVKNGFFLYSLTKVFITTDVTVTDTSEAVANRSVLSLAFID